jgi:hypothetical protein
MTLKVVNIAGSTFPHWREVTNLILTKKNEYELE